MTLHKVKPTYAKLLELVLFRALPRRDVKPLAKALLEKFGSFPEVIAASPQRLAEVPGLGDAAITELKVVQAAAERLARDQVRSRPVLSSWSALIDYCRGPPWRSPTRSSFASCFSTSATA